LVILTEAIGTRTALYQTTMPRKHTDLICWQLSDQLRQMVIRLTDTGKAARDLRFTSNLREAVSSACHNQSEGFYKYYHRQQRPFFNTARASLGEALDGIRDGLERAYFSEEDAKTMEALCNRAMKATMRWLQSLKRPDPQE
jgi:four helix bundle protein